MFGLWVRNIWTSVPQWCLFVTASCPVWLCGGDREGNKGIFSPTYCTSSQELQCQGKKSFPKTAVLSSLPAHVCVRVMSEAGRRLGCNRVGWASCGRATCSQISCLPEQAQVASQRCMSSWKPHLGLCCRSISFRNGMPFKCNDLLVVLGGQMVNKIIFVCYGIA